LASKKAPVKQDAKKDAKKEPKKAASTVVAKPVAKAAAKPATKPAAKPAAKAGKKAPAPAVKPVAKPASKPAAKVEVKPVAKPVAGNPVGKVVGKAVGKTVGKTVGKVVGQAPSKPDAKAAPAKPGSKPDAKAPATKAPGKVAAKDSAKGPVKGTAKADAKPAKGASGKAGDKSDSLDTPNVPKKGPIDLAQHKSVAEAAAAVANARGGTGEFIIINGRRVRAISTKGISVAKKPKSAAAEAAAAPSEQQIREIKTKLSKKELDEYRALLHTKRRQLVGMLSGMEDEALRSSGGNLSNMPIHMADMGSDVYEQDFTLGMAETERAIITEIDAALQRIEDKTFGICQMTGKPISKARLDAKPWAKYSIEAERIAESSGPR